LEKKNRVAREEKPVNKWIAFSLFCTALLYGGVASAQDNKADTVVSSCAHWASVKIDHKHNQFKGSSEDLYQTGVCIGYFEGSRIVVAHEVRTDPTCDLSDGPSTVRNP
jgi:hypothetical protein